MARRQWRLVAAASLLVPAPSTGADSIEARLATCLAVMARKGSHPSRGAVPGGQPSFYLTVQVLMFRDRLASSTL